VRFVHVLVRAAERICRLRQRGTKEYQAARRFLTWITAERLLTAAMLADAGLESLLLARAVDRKSPATEDTPIQLASFIQRISMLFVDGEAVNFGHTKWTLDLLKRRPMLIRVPPAAAGFPVKLRMLGFPNGVPSTIVKKCLGRLACWVFTPAQCLMVLVLLYAPLTDGA
jgi:hypothetical protein